MAFFPRMFDPNPKPAGYSDYQQEEAEIARRRALADALINRGLFQERDTKGTMVGGRYISPSAAGGIQDAIGLWAGGHMAQEAGEAARSMRDRQQKETEAWTKEMIEGKTSQQPFVAPGIDAADSAQASQGAYSNVQRPMTKQELMGHYMKGMQLGGPASAISMKGMEGILAQQAKQPNWKIEDRYNPETGRPEKVWVDTTNPGGPAIPFGGQKAIDPTDAAKRYQELRNMNFPDDIARGIAYGYLRPVQNSDGSTTLMDITQAAREGGMGQNPQPGQPAPATQGAPPTQAPPQPTQQPSTAPQLPAQAPVPQAGGGGTQSPYAPAARVPGQVGSTPPSGKPTQRLNDDTEKLGKDMQTKLVPETLSGIKEVNDLLNKMGIKMETRPGRAGPVREMTGDIPGFGLTGILHSAILSQDGKDMRGSVKSVANKLLQAQSGLAVTDQENKRFLEQLQQGTGMNDKDFISGWKRVLDEVDGKLGNYKGSFHPDVINEYSRRNPKITFNVGRPNVLLDTPQAPGASGPNPAAQFFGNK